MKELNSQFARERDEYQRTQLQIHLNKTPSADIISSSKHARPRVVTRGMQFDKFYSMILHEELINYTFWL